MIPFNIVDVLKDTLESYRRPPDGKLHCSSDIVGSLRHAQLSVAGAPKIASEVVGDVRMMTGTLWHEFFADAFVKKGIHFQQEIILDPGLPTGWSGRADWLFWSREYEAFVLGDLKTTKGEAMRWRLEEGASEAHLYQLSAYFHALVDMGYPMVNEANILYLPMNDTADKDELVEPVVMEFEPFPRNLVWDIMEDRWEATVAYLETEADDDDYLTGLAPEQERVEKVYWNKDKWEVKLVPHWSTKFCPYPNELCACSEQGTTKIGEYILHDNATTTYRPRKGYEDITPGVMPRIQDVSAKLKELNARAI